jgi:hypothetical protein
MNLLPYDIIELILIQLDCMDLYAMKSVSRTILGVSNRPYFYRKYAEKHKTQLYFPFIYHLLEEAYKNDTLYIHSNLDSHYNEKPLGFEWILLYSHEWIFKYSDKISLRWWYLKKLSQYYNSYKLSKILNTILEWTRYQKEYIIMKFLFDLYLLTRKYPYLNIHIDVNSIEYLGDTFLMKSCISHDIIAIQICFYYNQLFLEVEDNYLNNDNFIDQLIPINFYHTNYFEENIITLLARWGSVSLFQYVLEYLDKNDISISELINAPSFRGMTPLLIAIDMNRIEVVKLLLLYGANLYHKNYDGFDGLELCKIKHHDELYSFLL